MGSRYRGAAVQEEDRSPGHGWYCSALAPAGNRSNARANRRCRGGRGRPYLVDCGYGTLRQLVASNVGYLQVGTIFFTHLHDDHTGDVPALFSFQWTNGKTTATDAYGPYGTSRLITASVAVIRSNVVKSAPPMRAARWMRMHNSTDMMSPLRMHPYRYSRTTALPRHRHREYALSGTLQGPDDASQPRPAAGHQGSLHRVRRGHGVLGQRRQAGARRRRVHLPKRSRTRALLAQMEEQGKAAAAASNPNNIFPPRS